jgi:hypothetical protein
MEQEMPVSLIWYKPGGGAPGNTLRDDEADQTYGLGNAPN